MSKTVPTTRGASPIPVDVELGPMVLVALAGYPERILLQPVTNKRCAIVAADGDMYVDLALCCDCRTATLPTAW